MLPATKDVIGVIAKHGLVLATGHVSPDEGLLLLREGQKQGVQHMVVTHAMNTPVLMSVPQMKEAAKLGAMIEFVGGSPAGTAAGARFDSFADAIREVGLELLHSPQATSGRRTTRCPPTVSGPSSSR